MAEYDSPIFTRSYDLLRWLIPLTLRFPRQQRFVLAEATQQSALRLHERLIEARHTQMTLKSQPKGSAPTPAPTMQAAFQAIDVELDKLRHYLRLCHDLDLITISQYEHAAELLAEIGRLLGGWRKSVG